MNIFVRKITIREYGYFINISGYGAARRCTFLSWQR